MGLSSFFSFSGFFGLSGFLGPSEIGFAYYPVRFRYPNKITKAFYGAGRTGGINLSGLASQPAHKFFVF
jgi:hypothetical protein